MINTLYQEKSGRFKNKKAVLSVQAIVGENGMKKVGSLQLNISEFHNSPLDHHYFTLESCPDRSSKICISIKAQPLGDSAFADNASEASGFSGISMGTEGDYKGQLFSEDDVAEEQEALAPKIIPGSHGKPPLMKSQGLKLPETLPTYKVRVENEKSEEDSSKITELKAKNSILEKENTSIRNEKDELKIQLGIVSEKAIKERENLIEHIKGLDAELESIKSKNEKFNRKIARRDEKILNLKATNQNLLADLKEIERRSVESTDNKEKLKSEFSSLKDCLKESQDNSLKLQKQLDLSKYEITSLRTSNENLKEIIEQQKADILHLRQAIAETRDNMNSRGNDENVFANYKKNTELYINDLKRQLKSMEQEKEDALSKQSELAYQLQGSKTEKLTIEERHRDQIHELENEIQKLKDENITLVDKLEEEGQNKKLLERRTTMMSNDADLKLKRMTNNFQEMKAKKEELEQMLNEYQGKLKNKITETENAGIQNLAEQLANKDKIIEKLKVSLKDKEKELAEIYSNKEIIESENYTLREQIKRATITEFSDPANIILQEQINELEKRLQNQELAFNKEKIELQGTIDVLEKEIEILEIGKKADTEKFENQISKIIVQNQILTQQAESNKGPVKEEKNTSSLEIKIMEENYKQSLQLMQLENNSLKAKLSQLEEEHKALEKKHLDMKLSWANADIEKETILQKYRDAQEQLREYSAQFTAMEVELYKVNERFGLTLNQNNELELELHKLKQKLNGKEKKK
mmetsp:Transcript_29129/g.28845  ORF Transcript_29129/g.28845 Transcript_29129/m.28845 type:complete len:756 (-) Transcript_29129:53-2320(-)